MYTGAKPGLKMCQTVHVEGRKGKGRPRKTWNEAIVEDLHSWNLDINVAE
jgi:hypothetical protein